MAAVAIYQYCSWLLSTNYFNWSGFEPRYRGLYGWETALLPLDHRARLYKIPWECQKMVSMIFFYFCMSDACLAHSLIFDYDWEDSPLTCKRCLLSAGFLTTKNDTIVEFKHKFLRYRTYIYDDNCSVTEHRRVG